MVGSSPASEMLSSGPRRGEGAARGLRLPSTDGFTESILKELSFRSNLLAGVSGATVLNAGSDGAGDMLRDARRDDETVSDGAEKNRTIKVYSAEALSSKTSDSERKSASTGRF
jgi:hypothetical protein